MLQTPVHVSLLQKLLGYFQIAAEIGMVIPIPHEQAIATLIDGLIVELRNPATITTGQTNQPAGFAAPIPPTEIKKPEAQSAPPAVNETVGIPPTS